MISAYNQAIVYQRSKTVVAIVYVLDFSIAHPFSVVKNVIAKVRTDPFGLHDDI